MPEARGGRWGPPGTVRVLSGV
ncbi:MAG: hypothetical protein RLZ32_1282, partial [Gemmatimonadota bacterium]